MSPYLYRALMNETTPAHRRRAYLGTKLEKDAKRASEWNMTLEYRLAPAYESLELADAVEIPEYE